MESLKVRDLSTVASPGSRPATSRAADVLVDILIEEGVEVIFGLPGGPISPIHDALMDRPEVRVITTRHESGAMFAAAGYAQTSGKLGVAVVTSGPGVLNAMTGLASAWCDGLPVLLLVGEVARKNQGRGAVQDGSAYSLNIVAMARHITKLAQEVHEPNQAPAMLRRAIATALSGKRGPVALTLPMDTTTSKITAPSISLQVSTSHAIAPASLDSVQQELVASRRTVVFAGSGVRNGNGPARLRDFAERLQCPVMTTPKGKGVFPENHPLALGVFGLGGHPSATAYLRGGVDVLVAVGTSLGDIATDGWSPLLKPRRAFVHVDIEAQQLGRSYEVTHGIAAPAELFFSNLLERLPQSAAPNLAGMRWHAHPESVLAAPGRISPPRALWEIQQVLPDDAIYTNDMGDHSVFSTHYLQTNRPDAFVLMNGLGSMGCSIGAAIGAQLAQPARTVAAICGDGCFAMNAFEIATAVQQQIPIVVFVMNDQRLAMVENGHAQVYGRQPSYSMAPMNVAGVARALGAESLEVRQAGDILASELLRRRARGPIVVDVRIDPAIKMPRKDRFSPSTDETVLRLIN